MAKPTGTERLITDSVFKNPYSTKDDLSPSHCPVCGDGYFTATDVAEFFRLGGDWTMIATIEARRQAVCPLHAPPPPEG